MTSEPRSGDKLTKKESIVKAARDRLEEAWNNEKENREEASRDLAFIAGDQWPDQVRREREAERRPMLTINRLPQFLRQVTNDIRQADIAIKVAPVDDGSDPKMAKIFNGIIRQIQYQSSAHHVFATTAEHQSACGIGWFRISTEYADDSAFDQEIKLEAIPHPLSVYCDPAAIKPDRSDAMWMIATEMIPTATFKERFPDAAHNEVDRPSDGSSSRLFWTTADAVRVAEYWVKEPYTKVLGLTETGETIDLTEIKPENLALLPKIVKKRKQTAYKIRQYLVSGTDILEGPHEWPGKFIPLVPAIGAEVPLDQKTYRYGLVRFARDSQQMYNYYRTGIAEMIALAPKSPYLVTTKMLGDPKVKAVWDTANTKNRPYLPYDPDPNAPQGPKREHPPEMPAALVQEAMIASEDMKATTGIHDASLGARSNETSGRAILARQREGDVANYHFSDNLEYALQHAGRILIDLIPKIYDSERVIRIMGDDDAEEFIPINKAIMGVDGVPILVNDLSQARFDVRVTIGPSYSTKRMETAEAMLQFMQAVPQAAEVGADLIAKALDFPGAEEVAKRLRNLIPPAVLADPDDPNQPPPEPPPPLPDVVAAQAKMEADQASLQIEQQKAEIDMQKTTALTNAQLEKMQAEIALKRQQLEIDREKAQLDLLIKERSLELEERNHAAKIHAEHAKREPEREEASRVNEALMQALRAMSAPKRVVRDEAGRAIGVETVIDNAI